jgi:hypothetical protein
MPVASCSRKGGAIRKLSPVIFVDAVEPWSRPAASRSCFRAVRAPCRSVVGFAEMSGE